MTVLTMDIITDAMERAKENFGQPSVILTSQNTIDRLIEYQKYQDWLMTLPLRTRRQVMLKDKIKARRHINIRFAKLL